MATVKEDDIFSDDNKLEPAWIRWGKIGDWIKGTLLEVREMQSRIKGKENEMVKVYDMKMSGGKFHDDDGVETVIAAGDVYFLGGRKGIDPMMKRIKIGQVVALRFAEEIPSKETGFNAFKKIEVFEGEMDETYQGETANEKEVTPSDVPM